MGDPRIPWIVLLDVSTTQPPSPRSVADDLAELAADSGWPAPSSSAVSRAGHRELLARLASDSSEILRVGLRDDGVVVAGRHDALDGLALLAVARRLLGEEVRSTARGVGLGRLQAPQTRALLERAWEVAARPPARVASSRKAAAAGDRFATATVAGTPRTADLVHAGARAVAGWNASRGAPARRISVAVGVSTVGGESADLADNSAFLRLRGVERLGLDDVRDQLAHAPLQPGGGAHRGGLLSSASGVALRLAAPRLGSTLLVSHLGVVEAPPSVSDAAFYPVTGGGSGLSLGAATLHGRTTLTLRARAAQHDDEGLQQLLALVVEAI